MLNPFISGIQQVGLGVTNVEEAWAWYRKVLGFDVPVFDDSSEAKFMIDYTGGTVHSRRAIMALNMSGGGGLEIWQFTSRVSQPYSFIPRPGDIGIYAICFKSQHLQKSKDRLSTTSEKESVGQISQLPGGYNGFWGKDPYGNAFQITDDTSWFQINQQPNGGVAGVVIGVSDMEASIRFYTKLLGPCEVVFDQTGKFEDLPEASDETFRRVVIKKTATPNGAFSQLLGNIKIELLETKDRQPGRLFENRLWGDCGYIHVCFDTLDMEALRTHLSASDYHFTVDSGSSFGMESAAGRFAYVEDPDGTLIELVETHKLPILKKIGWYLDLKKRKNQKPLPSWMLKMMSLSRVRD
jgi:catechol 2,3-dioxygenase-like lactoylglutathione lyase family enzyme